MAKSTVQHGLFFFFFFFLLSFLTLTGSGFLAEIRLSEIRLSQNPREFSGSHSLGQILVSAYTIWLHGQIIIKIFIIIIIIIPPFSSLPSLWVFSHQFYHWFFHWHLNENMSSQISRRLLIILDDFNFNLDPLNSSSDLQFLQSIKQFLVRTVPRTPTKVGIIVIYMFHIFFSFLTQSQRHLVTANCSVFWSFDDDRIGVKLMVNKRCWLCIYAVLT